MKLTFTYFLFALGALSIAISYGSSQGRAAAAGAGNAGAPGDNPETCITCHGTSADIQVLMNLDMLDGAGDPVLNEYTPGVTYTLKVTVSDEVGTPAAYGFQLVALNAPLDENGDESSNYGVVSDNAKISTATTPARTYVEQKGPSATNEFTVEWTAPDAGSGPISFYTCGNGVNGNGSTGGDGAACLKVQFNEGVVNAVTNLQSIADLTIFPNPVSDNLTVQMEVTSGQEGNWMLNNLSGQIMATDFMNLSTGANTVNIPMGNMPTGIYFLKIQTEEGFLTKRIVKQ